MKLLCISPWYHPACQFGGPIASIHGLNKALSKQGIDVTVFTTHAGIEDKVPANQPCNVDGITVTYFGVQGASGLPGLRSWQFSLEMTKALRNRLLQFDLVYINGVWTYPTAAASYYSRQYNKPHIIAPRGMLYHYTMASKAWKKWPYYHLISKRDMHGASAIHYTTRDEASQCHERLKLKNPSFVVPNGVDLSFLESAPDKSHGLEPFSVPKDKKIILFLGRICWIKGLDILVRAFSMLARKRDDIHLLIAGPDEDGYEKKVRGWLDEQGVSDMASFTGMLEGHDKARVFSGSDIFVLPSYSENFGMVVVEAMACGLPVVISNQVGIYDDVEHNQTGLVVETDPGQLAEALNRLLDNPRLRHEMAARGEALVATRYDRSQVAGSMIDRFNEIISASH